MKKRVALILLTLGITASLAGCGSDTTTVQAGGAESTPAASAEKLVLTIVSYDPTRELYAAYNEVFKKHYEETFGQQIEVTQSHGGSGKQALEVANGLEADVVTLALEGDVQCRRCQFCEYAKFGRVTDALFRG